MQKQKIIIIVFLMIVAIGTVIFLQKNKKTNIDNNIPASREEVLEHLSYETVMAGVDAREGGKALSEEELRYSQEVLAQKIADQLEILAEPDLYIQLATLQYNLGNKAYAIDILEQAKTTFPQDETIINSLENIRSAVLEDDSSVIPHSVIRALEYDEDGNEIIHEGGAL